MDNQDTLQILEWRCNLSTGEISNGHETQTLEPKSIELLFFMAQNHSRVLSKDQIIEAVWNNAIVSDDVLAKTISKLRKALNDNPKEPRFIETLPKRGYRFKVVPTTSDSAQPTPETEKKTHRRKFFLPIWLFIMVVSLVTVFSQRRNDEQKTEQSDQELNQEEQQKLSPELQNLKEQADNYYFQYTRTDNENAIKLYERIIAAEPEFGPAQSGLATALVQKVLRWPNELGTPDINHSSLTQAHQEQRLASPETQLYLSRAEALAERAVRLSPNDYMVHRSLGLVYAAQQQYAEAEKHYDKAIELNPNAWGAMINKAEIAQLNGDDERYLQLMEQAYQAMTNVYDQQVAKVRPWYPKIGVAIADKYVQLNEPQEAEIWYRTVLNYSPLDKDANVGLMKLMQANGQQESYQEICQRIRLSIDPESNCNQ